MKPADRRCGASSAHAIHYRRCDGARTKTRPGAAVPVAPSGRAGRPLSGNRRRRRLQAYPTLRAPQRRAPIRGDRANPPVRASPWEFSLLGYAGTLILARSNRAPSCVMAAYEKPTLDTRRRVRPALAGRCPGNVRYRTHFVRHLTNVALRFGVPLYRDVEIDRQRIRYRARLLLLVRRHGNVRPRNRRQERQLHLVRYR